MLASRLHTSIICPFRLALDFLDWYKQKKHNLVPECDPFLANVCHASRRMEKHSFQKKRVDTMFNDLHNRVMCARATLVIVNYVHDKCISFITSIAHATVLGHKNFVPRGSR